MHTHTDVGFRSQLVSGGSRHPFSATHAAPAPSSPPRTLPTALLTLRNGQSILTAWTKHS